MGCKQSSARDEGDENGNRQAGRLNREALTEHEAQNQRQQQRRSGSRRPRGSDPTAHPHGNGHAAGHDVHTDATQTEQWVHQQNTIFSVGGPPDVSGIAPTEGFDVSYNPYHGADRSPPPMLVGARGVDHASPTRSLLPMLSVRKTRPDADRDSNDDEPALTPVRFFPLSNPVGELNWRTPEPRQAARAVPVASTSTQATPSSEPALAPLSPEIIAGGLQSPAPRPERRTRSTEGSGHAARRGPLIPGYDSGASPQTVTRTSRSMSRNPIDAASGATPHTQRRSRSRHGESAQRHIEAQIARRDESERRAVTPEGDDDQEAPSVRGGDRRSNAATNLTTASVVSMRAVGRCRAVLTTACAIDNSLAQRRRQLTTTGAVTDVFGGPVREYRRPKVTFASGGNANAFLT